MRIRYRLKRGEVFIFRTKLEIPGWGGERQPRADGSTEQVWHCLPFTEGAQYGIEFFYPYANEFFYPYANELRVTTREGKLHLDGDFGPDPETGSCIRLQRLEAQL